MEAMAVGRLLLIRPLSGEQFCNEKLVVEVAGMGESMMGAKRDYEPGEEDREGVVLSRERVAERVRWAHGTSAETVRKSAWNFRLVARKGTVKGGSSYASVDCIMEDIRCRREKKMEAIVRN